MAFTLESRTSPNPPHSAVSSTTSRAKAMAQDQLKLHSVPPTQSSDPQANDSLALIARKGIHIGMTKKDTHDAYIAAAPEQFRALLGQLRVQLLQALPDAEEVVKYDMPGFQIGETIIAGYAAFSKQCGLYIDPGAIAAHANEIASLRLKATKTGVTFTASKPITEELVRKLAISSRQEKGL